MSMPNRSAVHHAFTMDEVQVVVATIAFGMGIDKPSIRRVVHYGCVRSLEHYVQQCGRAGRDGQDAECLMYMRPQDESEAQRLIMKDFATNHGGDSGDGAAHCERMLAHLAEFVAFATDR